MDAHIQFIRELLYIRQAGEGEEQQGLLLLLEQVEKVEVLMENLVQEKPQVMLLPIQEAVVEVQTEQVEQVEVEL